MRAVTVRAGLTAAAVAIGALSMSACTPLRVVTQTVSADEAQVPVGEYKLDADHWSVTFDVEHLKYSRVVMRFDHAHGKLDWKKGGLEASTVDVAIDAASVDTKVPLLDKMVKGPDMFDAATYPTIHFVGTHFVRTGPSKGKLEGDLTIRTVTRPVTLDVTFNGYGRNPLTKANTLGFSGQGTFSRAQFGLATWYPAVGNDVHVRIEAEFEQPQD
ncbi:YceI family protein [Trinickia dinghuensis]|uniref:YceI family protein n=1 Tax=Trinickia dinghuensis TaxID=2291023 RepID=A0A3D8K8M8_9BURK|nr:YceI family protein [Trinickia dinghuensis]RDV00992.1 YceI family protein [Trinickia dinghuensis]